MAALHLVPTRRRFWFKPNERCESTRSFGYDPTGENAIECGGIPVAECEYCGVLCAECYLAPCADTCGEHKIVEGV